MGSHAILGNLVTLVLVIATILRASEACVTDEFTIVIASNLPPDSPDTLKLHCKSKNNDLGYHELYPGKQFPWSFCESFWHNTLFSCDLSWGPRFQSFVAFSSRGERCKGDRCYWVAAADGIYYGRAGEALVKKFDWQIRNT